MNRNADHLPRTHLSLYYLAGYLIPVGLALMVAPQTSMALLFSNQQYHSAFPRLAGVLLLSLGIIVAQVIRLKLDKLYPVTLLVRSIIAPWLLWIYIESGNPLFLMMLAVVAFGLVLTGTCYLLDRK
jgi:hypothetical protein